LTTTRPISVDCSQVATAGNRYVTEASFNVARFSGRRVCLSAYRSFNHCCSVSRTWCL